MGRRGRACVPWQARNVPLERRLGSHLGRVASFVLPRGPFELGRECELHATVHRWHGTKLERVGELPSTHIHPPCAKSRQTCHGLALVMPQTLNPKTLKFHELGRGA